MLPLSDGIPRTTVPDRQRLAEPWGLSWITAMLLHGGWDHILFLANGGGVAFFAHVGGFIFGLLVARLPGRAGQAAPGEQWRSTA